MFKTGFATRVITPDREAWLSGYAARHKPSCGVHDDIFVKAFYVTDGATEAVFVYCDLVGVPCGMLDNIRNKARARLGFENITVGATHNHSAPATSEQFFRENESLDEEWLSLVEELAVEAICEAAKNAAPARLFLGNDRVPEVTRNRRVGETSVDDEVIVLYSEDETGRITGLLVNYACHCTILDANNYLISADYPGCLYKQLGGKYEEATIIFANGACGNLNIGYSADASALGTDMGDLRTYANANRKASFLMAGVERAMAKAHELEPSMLFLRVPLSLPIRKELPTRRQLEGRVAEINGKIVACTDAVKAEKLEIDRIYALSLYRSITGYIKEGDDVIHAESIAMRLGDFVIVTAPGELFCEIGMAIKRIFSGKYLTAMFGYTNGYFGYLPTKAALLAGGYECETCVYSPEMESYILSVMSEVKRSMDA